MARTPRVTVEEPCVHGIHDRHPVDDVTEWSTARTWCPGGSRRVLDPGSFVLIEDVEDLPSDAWRVLNATAAFGHPNGSVALWRDLRAALRGEPIPSLDES